MDTAGMVYGTGRNEQNGLSSTFSRIHFPRGPRNICCGWALNNTGSGRKTFSGSTHFHSGVSLLLGLAFTLHIYRKAEELMRLMPVPACRSYHINGSKYTGGWDTRPSGDASWKHHPSKPTNILLLRTMFCMVTACILVFPAGNLRPLSQAGRLASGG